MGDPGPNRPARLTTELKMRVPGDDELADGVTAIGNALDDVDSAVATASRTPIAVSFLLMGA
jgi:hypothetical protein